VVPELIFLHCHLGFNFLEEVNDNRNNDEEGGAADGEGGLVGNGTNDERENGDDTEEEGAERSEARKDFRDVKRC